MRYFETSLSPIDKKPNSKFLITTKIGDTAVRKNKYLSKYASLEKSANPLAWIISGGARLAGPGAKKWLTSTLDSKWVGTASKWTGSQGTTDSLLKSKNPLIQQFASGKIKSTTGQNFQQILQQNAGMDRFVNTNKLTPGVREAFKQRMDPKYTLSKAWNSSEGRAKGMWDWAKHQFGANDNIWSNMRQSYTDNFVQSRANKDLIYRGSRLGNLTRNVASKGFDTYLVGDAFLGDTLPGETRTGKVTSNLGFLAGMRSTPGMFKSILRGGVLGSAGGVVGNKIGKVTPEPKEPKLTYDPVLNQYRYI